MTTGTDGGKINIMLINVLLSLFSHDFEIFLNASYRIIPFVFILRIHYILNMR